MRTVVILSSAWLLAFTAAAQADTHYGIVARLGGGSASSKKPLKEQAEVQITATFQALFDVVAYPPNAAPTLPAKVPMSSSYYGTSAWSTMPNLATLATSPMLVRVSLSAGSSRCTLRQQGAGQEIATELPPATESVGTGFCFPVGDMTGKTATLLVANPNALVSTVRVRVGSPTAIASIQPINANQVVSIPLAASETGVFVQTDLPALVVLEVDHGTDGVTRTLIPPGC